MFSQTVPVMQSRFFEHVGVQRFGPFTTYDRQRRGDTQSASALHRSSAWLVPIGPPLVVDAVVLTLDVTEDVAVDDVAVVDDEVGIDPPADDVVAPPVPCALLCEEVVVPPLPGPPPPVFDSSH